MDGLVSSSAIFLLTHSVTSNALLRRASNATAPQDFPLFELAALIIFKPTARKFLFQFFQKVDIFFTLLIALVP
jgi:hypothetical protein